MKGTPARRPPRGTGHRRGQRGYLLLAVLVGLMLAAVAAVDYGQRRVHERQRDDEAELLFVGEQYRQAIESYWRQSPGAKVPPMRLSDLLQDPRFPQARRHLRKLFADPLAPAAEWGLVRQGEAIIGVYSQAPGSPFRKSGFADNQAGFETAERYADWRFVARLAAPPSPKASQAKP